MEAITSKFTSTSWDHHGIEDSKVFLECSGVGGAVLAAPPPPLFPRWQGLFGMSIKHVRRQGALLQHATPSAAPLRDSLLVCRPLSTELNR